MRDDTDRAMMPGKIYDIVRHHENVSFAKARHWIRKSKVKVIEGSANLFRNCVQPLADDAARSLLQRSYASTRKEHLRLTYLAKIDNDGLYESTSRRFYGSASQRLNEPAHEIPDTLVQLECLYESLLRNLADGRTGLQGFHLHADDGVPSALSSMPYHTSPRLNPRLEAREGVNVPTFRLGTRHSLEELHKSHGLLDRVDLLHWGASRLWLVVQLNFQRALELRLGSRLTRRGGYPPWCPAPTYHREFVALPSLLRKWAIPFEIVVQRPGDLLHLRDWVPHQVLDLGTNIGETVSVGSAEWNMSAADNSAFVNCPCGTKSSVEEEEADLGKNDEVYAKVELVVRRSRPTPCTHVVRAIEAAKEERGDAAPGHNRYLPPDYDAVPVLKEYRKSTRRKSNDKCYGCGKRTDDLKSHLSRHIMCRAKLNLARDEEIVEEPLTDESDEEMSCDTAADDYGDDAKFHCAHCRQPFEHRINLVKHIILLHRQSASLKRSPEEPVVVKRKRLKVC